MRSWIAEARFALTRTASLKQAGQLLAHTALFHLGNRGFAQDRQTKLNVTVSIGEQRRAIALRTGRIGDLFVLYEVLAFDAYRIPPQLVAPQSVETIIDCGANVGLTSLYFASTYPAARIYSVEADPENFALLRANTASEPRIVPVHACVVSTPQSAVSFDTFGPAWGRRNLATGKGTAVPAMTLDELLTKFSIASVDLLKMDIEGAEREVLSVGSYLDAVQHMAIELHGDYTLADFGKAVGSHGLRVRPADDSCAVITAHRG